MLLNRSEDVRPLPQTRPRLLIVQGYIVRYSLNVILVFVVLVDARSLAAAQHDPRASSRSASQSPNRIALLFKYTLRIKLALRTPAIQPDPALCHASTSSFCESGFTLRLVTQPGRAAAPHRYTALVSTSAKHHGDGHKSRQGLPQVLTCAAMVAPYLIWHPQRWL